MRTQAIRTAKRERQCGLRLVDEHLRGPQTQRQDGTLARAAVTEVRSRTRAGAARGSHGIHIADVTMTLCPPRLIRWPARKSGGR